MKFIVDSLFKDTYKLYYNGMSESIILENVNKVFKRYNSELIYDTINIIKTAVTVNYTYTECYNIIISKILSKFPTDDNIDLFILNLFIKIMIESKSECINKIISRPRNIYKEITAKHYRLPTSKIDDKMIDSVIDISNKFTNNVYSIELESSNGWDDYFYKMCLQVGSNSKCLSRKIGAVLVNDKSIISTGYNGPPRGIPRCDLRWAIDEKFNKKYGSIKIDKDVEGKCPRKVIGYKSGEGLGICVAGHAERNTLINAARTGTKTLGSTLYMSCGISCTPCLIEIINAGVKEIVVASLKTYDENAMYLLNHSSLEVRLFDFIK